jgi:hypothetical protein
MATDSATELRHRLKTFGLSDSAIQAAWPRWWSEAANESPSARAELHFSVARNLGFDPRSLIDPNQNPRFIWKDEARFKHLSGEDDVERAGITSFGRAVTSILVRAAPEADATIVGQSASELRRAVLAQDRPVVALGDLLAMAWGTGVPVVHLRVFPWERKRMAAMTVRLGDRWSVLLGKDASYPPQIAFYLAHELGHIALGHIAAGDQIVDLDEAGDEPSAQDGESDVEEREADAFALELLTGFPSPTILPAQSGWATARELARTASAVADELQIEAGTATLIYGHSTGDWQLANAALRYIYPEPAEVWVSINGYARHELAFDQLTFDGAEFLKAVLGDAEPG